MYSIAFPNIFNGSTVNLTKDYDAIKVNLKSLLMSNRGGLYGDPHYGLDMKKILWSQASAPLTLDRKNRDKWGRDPITVELLKDEIFNAIYSYMPQISIERNDIDIDVSGTLVQASIQVKADSKIPSDLFNIEILMPEEK